MADSSSVTEWIDGLKGGDEAAASKIWRRYGPDLLRLARRKLRNARNRVSDEDDLALVAFTHFCFGVRDGRFKQLEGRDDLWHLLVMLAGRRSIDQLRRDTRRNERGESVFLDGASTSSATQRGPANLPSDTPPPETALQAIEDCSKLLDCLTDDLQQIAIWKMEGYTNQEIAVEKLKVAERTVERKLKLIRQKWTEVFDLGDSPAVEADEAT